MEEITQIDFFAATVLVSLGAVIGKLTLGQYLIIALFETFFASLNYYLCYFALGGIDTGGSLYIYAQTLQGEVFALDGYDHRVAGC